MITLDDVSRWSRKYLVWREELFFLRDNLLRLVDNLDTTKRGVFQLSNITTGTTRTLEWPDQSGTIALIGDTVACPVALTHYQDRNSKFVLEQIHGAFQALATAQPLDAVPTDIVVTKNIGKLVVVVNAGSDLAGAITVTGTSVNRETGDETGSDTSTITVDALTTDNTDTDAGGNTRWAMVGAYITDKWFTGSVTLSTTDLTLTDVDVYHVSFEQFNDSPSVTLRTFDVNACPTNANATMYTYLYSLAVTGDKCTIAREADLVVTSPTADEFTRKRVGNIDTALVGTSDGIWVDMILGPLNQNYWDDLTMKVWADLDIAVE